MTKKTILACFLLATSFFVVAQTKPKTKQPSQAEINKMMEEAMKNEDMSKEEQAEMKKMMGEIMPAIIENKQVAANYPSFSNNKQLIPKKNIASTTTATHKKLTQAQMSDYATGLFLKLITRGSSTETALAKKLIAQFSKHSDINSAAIMCMLQGHPEAAMALSMKAVVLDPTNTNYQNNMAGLLTQYGYPELSLPILNKLWMGNPGNSTVMNNLAYAWLSLGETDSARMYANGAIMVNPSHPEAMLCGGLMDEIMGGDPIDKYTGAMENAPNDFTKSMLENSGSHNTKLSWDKIKRNIAIHEYFPKDWMQMPAPLTNDVKNYNEDMAVKKAYADMVEKITTDIEAMTESLGKDLDNLVDKGEDAFVKEMAKESLKGLSWMSKPATEVVKILIAYQMQVQFELADSLKKILAWKQNLEKEKEIAINKIYKKISNSKGTTCEQFKTQLDELENDYMRKTNNRLRKLLVNNVNEYRQWLNAFITWNWYITGNIKNTVLIQDLNATAHLVATYGEIVNSMETHPEHCNAKVYEVDKKIATPAIPNFTCPAVVSIPSGKEWQQLSSTAKNFDANKQGIKASGAPMPNVSVAYGVGSMIAQPGIAPSIKTANGSVTPMTGSADELTPIPNIPQDELAPIPNIPEDKLEPIPNIPKEDELTPIPDLRKSQLAKELLKKTMTANCAGKKATKKLKFTVKADFKNLKIDEVPEITVGIGELVMDPLPEFVVGMGELVMDPLPAKGEFKVGIGKLEFLPIAKPEVQKIAQEVKQAVSEGLQPTISNGMQVPGTFKPNTGLFK